jgi:hypothetical protein
MLSLLPHLFLVIFSSHNLGAKVQLHIAKVYVAILPEQPLTY